MGQITKQDAQNLIENAKNRIIEKVASRQDVQLLSEASRDRIMNYVRDLLQVYQQNLLRRGEFYQSQSQRRLAAMETRMTTLEQELKVMRQLLERIADQEPQRIYMPLEADKNGKQPYTEYVYRPT